VCDDVGDGGDAEEDAGATGLVAGGAVAGRPDGVLVDASGCGEGFRLGLARWDLVAGLVGGTARDLVAACGELSGTTPRPARSITTQTTVETTATTASHELIAASIGLGGIMTTSSPSSGRVARLDLPREALPSAHERHPGHRG
jgi:hypothetical protein